MLSPACPWKATRRGSVEIPTSRSPQRPFSDQLASARMAVATMASASAGVNPPCPVAIRYIAGPKMRSSATSGSRFGSSSPRATPRSQIVLTAARRRFTWWVRIRSRSVVPGSGHHPKPDAAPRTPRLGSRPSRIRRHESHLRHRPDPAVHPNRATADRVGLGWRATAGWHARAYPRKAFHAGFGVNASRRRLTWIHPDALSVRLTQPASVAPQHISPEALAFVLLVTVSSVAGAARRSFG